MVIDLIGEIKKGSHIGEPLWFTTKNRPTKRDP